MNKTVAALLLLLLAGLALAGSAAAAVPTTLNYQGKLTNAGGLAVPDGPYGIVFRFYEESTGGAFVFEQARAVQVTNGVFDTVIGGDGVAGWPDFASELWLELEVTPPGAPMAEPPLPRQLLTSSPYAQNARTVQDRAITSVKIADGEVMTADIGDGQVTTAHIADGAVTHGRITQAKLSASPGWKLMPTHEVLGGHVLYSGQIDLGDEPGTVFANVQLPEFRITWPCTADGLSEAQIIVTLAVGSRSVQAIATGVANECVSGERILKIPVSLSEMVPLGSGVHTIGVSGNWQDTQRIGLASPAGGFVAAFKVLAFTIGR